jgi:hypothetical protein
MRSRCSSCRLQSSTDIDRVGTSQRWSTACIGHTHTCGRAHTHTYTRTHAPPPPRTVTYVRTHSHPGTRTDGHQWAPLVHSSVRARAWATPRVTLLWTVAADALCVCTSTVLVYQGEPVRPR